MTAGLAPYPILKVTNADGTAAAYCWVHTYAAGTSTPLATFTDYTGNTPNTNPFQLDANGQANCRFAAVPYKVEVRDSTDTIVLPGWPQDYVYTSDKTGADLSATLAATTGAGLEGYSALNTYARKTVGDALGRTIYVESLIPVGYNTATNDCSAYILTAIGLGNCIEFKHDTDYFVGNLSAAQIVFDLALTSQFRVVGNNARIVCNTTDGTKPSIFRFKNPNRITVENLRFKDNSASAFTTSATKAVCIDLADNGPSADNVGVLLINCEANNCAALMDIRSISGSTYHTRDIYLDACRAINSFYGVRATSTGNYIEGTLYCENCIHDVQLENTVGSNLSVVSRRDTTLTGGDTPAGAVIYKRSGASGTKSSGHKLRLKVEGGATSAGTVDPVVLVSEDSTAGGTFSDMDLDVDIRAMNSGSPPDALVSVRAYIGAAEQVSTPSVYTNMVIRGCNLLGGTVALPPLYRKALAVSNATQGDFSLLCSVNGQFRDSTYSSGSYWAFREGAFVDYYMVIGDPTSRFILIPMPNIGATTVPFAVRLQCFVSDSAAATNSSYREFTLIGNSNAGTITLLSSTAATYTLDQGVAPATFPVAVSGSNLKVGPVTGAGYTGATASLHARITRIGISN